MSAHKPIVASVPLVSHVCGARSLVHSPWPLHDAAVCVEDVPSMLFRHPRVLGLSLEALRAKHAFITDEWGRTVKEIEIFPQALTYSLDFLRARAGFLLAHGRADAHHLHRILRTADYLTHFDTVACAKAA